MFINNSIHQYNNYGNTNNINQSQSTQSLTGNTIDELKSGQVFEGSVNSIDSSGKVVIGLANGQTMSARLDNGVSLTEGQSLFFQVKSNDGNLIQIKPISLNIDTNPTLLKALDSASVMATEKSIKMVNAMMNQSMSIDSDSIATMNRQVLTNPQIEPDTIVLMNKYGIPVTAENASMFEVYSTNQASIMNDIDALVSKIPQLLTSSDVSVEDVTYISNQLNTIFNTNESFEADSQTLSVEKNVLDNTSHNTDSTIINNDTVMSDVSNKLDFENVSKELTQKEQNLLSDIKMLVSKEEGLNSNLAKFLDANEDLKPNITNNDVLREIVKYINDNNLSKSSLDSLLGSREFKYILSNVISDSFSLEPEDIIKPKELTKLYDKIIKELDQFEKSIQNISSKVSDSIKQGVANIKDNVSFMNSSNDIYTFIQIPLKMYDQNTDSTLHVRQNKKNAYEEGEEITAFLHFDMEYLGSTDVYITLKAKDVSCKWNLENENSMKLIEENIDLLNERLSKKGFNCTMKVECTDKKIDFVEDFLNSTVQNNNNGLLHRYSFDMRA